jgi:hypothetical protein
MRNAELAHPNLSRKKARHFPPPWSIEDLGAAFVVKDSARHKLAYIYYKDGRDGRTATKLLSRRGAAERGRHRQAAGAAAQ